MKGYTVYSKIQQMIQAGFSQRQVARRLDISRKTVKRYWEMPVEEYEEISQGHQDRAQDRRGLLPDI